MMEHLKRALVIGATGGIGRAVVEELFGAGFYVALSARNKEKLEELARSLPKGKTVIIPADISNRESIENLFAVLKTELKEPIDIIVVAAGGWAPNGFDSDIASFEENLSKMVDQNLTGPAVALFAGAKYLKNQGGGILVNISSHAARKSLAGNLGYGPTKSGIYWFTQLLNDEAGETVRVTDIQPAVVNTGAGAFGGVAFAECHGTTLRPPMHPSRLTERQL